MAITAEMAEMAEACAARDVARAKLAEAKLALREAARECDAATSRHTMALDALERSCRAALPTLPGPT